MRAAFLAAADGVEAEAMRAFRDRLRGDPAFRAVYAALKRAILASGITDSLEYSRAKGAFFGAVRAGRRSDAVGQSQ